MFGRIRPLGRVLAVALLGACTGSGGSAPPRAASLDVAVNGGVHAIAVAPDGTIYLGGSFTVVGPATGDVVVLAPDTGALAAPPPRLHGFAAAAADGRGGWYVGVPASDGAPSTTLVRIQADGTVDPGFHATFDGLVSALAVANGVVYVGGRFEHAGATARHLLAAVDGVTGAVAPWDPGRDTSAFPALAPAAYPWVRALAADGGWIYAGGRRDGSGWLAAIDPAGAVSTWSASTDLVSASGPLALAVRDGTLFVGGSFTTVNGAARSGLAAFDPGGALSAWSPEAPSVKALAFADRTLYAAGEFESAGGAPHRGIVAFDPAGAPSAWDPGLDGPAHALAALGGTLYVGGAFERVGGEQRMHLAAFGPGGALAAWNPVAGGDVTALSPSGGRLLAGGAIWSIGGVRRSAVAALDAGGHVTAWDPDVGGTGGVSPTVKAIAVAGERIFVGGAFETVAGRARPNLAAVDRGGAVLDATPRVNGPVYALAPLGDTIWVGGTFSTLGGLPRGLLGVFDPAAAGSVLGFDPGLSLASSPYDPAVPICPIPGCRPPAVWALAPRSGRMYVGGDFGYAGARAGVTAATARAAGAAFTASGALLPWDPGASAFRWGPKLYALAATDRGVYATGSFGWIGGSSRNGVALLDADTAAASPWDPAAGNDGHEVAGYALLVQDRTVYVGGMFYRFGGAPRACLAAAGVDTGAVTPWNPAASCTGSTLALAAGAGRILAGGWGLADYAP